MPTWSHTLATPLGPMGAAFDAKGRLKGFGFLKGNLNPLLEGRCPASDQAFKFLKTQRVIGSDGSLTGYGGGLDRKRTLLEREGVLRKEVETPALFEGY